RASTLLKAEYFQPLADFRHDRARTVVWEKLLPPVRLRARSRQCRAERGQLCDDTTGDIAPARARATAPCAPPTTVCGPPPRPSARYWHPPPARACGIDLARTQSRHCYHE